MADEIIRKAQTLRGQFTQIINQFTDEGRHDLARQTTKAISDVPDESMAKLYDILQKVFAGHLITRDEVVAEMQSFNLDFDDEMIDRYTNEANRLATPDLTALKLIRCWFDQEERDIRIEGQVADQFEQDAYGPRD